MAAPALRMDRRGKWTPASLRDHYRYQISHIDGTERLPFAFGVLAAINSGHGRDWTFAQRRAVTEGLELGMGEGIR